MTMLNPLRPFARFAPARWVGLILSVMLVSGCLTRQPVTYQEMSRSDPASTPRSIAVLPFRNRTPQPDLAPLVRKGFYAHLSYRRYQDVELVVVDHVLSEHGLGADTPWSAEQLRLLGDWLNCDAVVIGEVDHFERLYAAVYSRLSIGARITIYDTRTGRRIWSDNYRARLHEGDVPLTALGLPLSSIRTGMNLQGREIITAVDKLTRQLADRMPDHGNKDADRAGYHYELQIGAYRDHQFALDARDRLQKQGYPASVRSETTPDAIWHRVVVGPYQDEKKALAARRKLEELLATRPLLRRQATAGVSD